MTQSACTAVAQIFSWDNHGCPYVQYHEASPQAQARDGKENLRTRRPPVALPQGVSTLSMEDVETDKKILIAFYMREEPQSATEEKVSKIIRWAHFCSVLRNCV